MAGLREIGVIHVGEIKRGLLAQRLQNGKVVLRKECTRYTCTPMRHSTSVNNTTEAVYAGTFNMPTSYQ